MECTLYKAPTLQTHTHCLTNEPVRGSCTRSTALAVLLPIKGENAVHDATVPVLETGLIVGTETSFSTAKRDHLIGLPCTRVVTRSTYLISMEEADMHSYS